MRKIPLLLLSAFLVATGAVAQTLQVTPQETVSVVDFGADPAGVADSAPAFRQAIQSDRHIIVPPGTYKFASLENYRPHGRGNRTPVIINGKKNFKLSGYGATIVIDPQIWQTDRQYAAAIPISALTFWKSTNFEIEGLTIQGTREGLTRINQINAGIVLFSDVNFDIHNLHFSGNYGGAGSSISADWLVNGKIHHNRQDSVGQCGDLAFLQNVEIYANASTGAGLDGIPSPASKGLKCWSIIYDGPNADNNDTGISFNMTNNISIHNNYVTNFGAGAFISSGAHYIFYGNTWSKNTRRGPNLGAGIYVAYTASGSFKSKGLPASDITIRGDKFIQTGFGVFINPAALNSSDSIHDISIINCEFSNNQTGIFVKGTAHFANLYTRDNLYAGASQIPLNPSASAARVTPGQ